VNVLDLADARADLATAGGKGASLARLARAGLPVPPGFHVTTRAYRTYVEQHGRDFTREIPPDIARDIRTAYRGGPVAVRSSATAEDLPDLSFAGQQDTFLDVSGEAEVLDAVRRCWASLWNERATVYRERHGVDAEAVAMAVVVQEMVPADAAGVLFTEDRGRLVINAARGLGEAVVGGQVTPDVLVFDRASGTEIERTIPEGRGPALTAGQAARLFELGREIEALYGYAMDVEWAVHEGEPYILQARPVTGLLEEWNDSLLGDYLWTNGNLGEAIPSVMTPSTWSVVRMFMAEAMVLAELDGHPICGNIGGRFYMNLSLTSSVAAALGLRKLLEEAQESVFGRLPEGITAPLLP
jgi:rifampicin phosphotransferase